MLIVLIAAAVLAADQVSKHLIGSFVEPYAAIHVFSNFNLVHIYNRGISFGLLNGLSSYGPYIISLFGLGIITFLSILAFRTDSALQQAAFAAIIGGAASNILDRLGDGAVTDFLDFHVATYHWPAFNLADAAIVCGAAALLLQPFIPAAGHAGQRGQA
jgi:signal peptidase II